MEIERQRGISVATSVMAFEYEGYKVNILDTPGHEDFAEDTYRTLTAVDSAIMVIDCVKGVEPQTRKLLEVCRMRNTPVIVFINKMDREGRDAFDLLDEIEKELKIKVRPLSWPIGIGKSFKGVYNLYEKKLNLFRGENKQIVEDTIEVRNLKDGSLENFISGDFADKLREEVEIIESVYPEFSANDYQQGSICPVFFGSEIGRAHV